VCKEEHQQQVCVPSLLLSGSEWRFCIGFLLGLSHACLHARVHLINHAEAWASCCNTLTAATAITWRKAGYCRLDIQDFQKGLYV
jgi:hypothetical protein